MYSNTTSYTMKTNTKKELIEFIKTHQGTTIKEIMQNIQLYSTGIFRHLRELALKKIIYKVGKPPFVRYYSFTDMKTSSKLFEYGMDWALSGNAQFLSMPHVTFSPTSDVFRARTESLVDGLLKETSEGIAFILTAVVGEIGNNSFDHNIGHWHDVMGVYFAVDYISREIVLADRGQGVFATLKKVRPEIEDVKEALRVAFTEIVSGRAPETRGNGLKFVKKQIETNHFYLRFYSGNAIIEITETSMELQDSSDVIPGTLAYIKY